MRFDLISEITANSRISTFRTIFALRLIVMSDGVIIYAYRSVEIAAFKISLTSLLIKTNIVRGKSNELRNYHKIFV